MDIIRIENIGVIDKKEAVFNTIVSSGQKGGYIFQQNFQLNFQQYIFVLSN